MRHIFVRNCRASARASKRGEQARFKFSSECDESERQSKRKAKQETERKALSERSRASARQKSERERQLMSERAKRAQINAEQARGKAIERGIFQANVQKTLERDLAQGHSE